MCLSRIGVARTVQSDGWSAERVASEVRRLRAQDLSYAAGQVVGSMCTAPHPVALDAMNVFAEANLGDPGHFPGAAQMEREVLADVQQLLHAPPGAGSRFVSGGTEANVLACLLARQKTGKRQIVVPEPAHFSFAKAALMLGMTVVKVAALPDGRADAAAMEQACGPDTALMVAIAGSTEQGLVDDVPALARAATRRGVLLHVDAAFGGYVLPFLPGTAPFDFALAGVWSVALDPHKMGAATIPAGILVLRDEGDWRLSAIESPYVSTDTQSTLLGTRPGSAVAATWAVHRHLGRAGYAKAAADCMATTRHLAQAIVAAGYVLASPVELNVIAFRAADPAGLQRRLRAHGFGVNVVPRLRAIRLVVGPHVTRAVADRFVAALRAVGP